MTRHLSASDLIYVNLVTAAMDRAYLAAEMVAADHPGAVDRGLPGRSLGYRSARRVAADRLHRDGYRL